MISGIASSGFPLIHGRLGVGEPLSGRFVFAFVFLVIRNKILRHFEPLHVIPVVKSSLPTKPDFNKFIRDFSSLKI